jgi:ligand-binding SRPBCC domain-containing protein
LPRALATGVAAGTNRNYNMGMRTAYRLDTWLWLPRRRTEVFAFFADAANLERITPSFLAFHILTPLPVDMRAGTLIDYRVGLRGLPMKWQSKITTWEPPIRFADVQVRGPYREWTHTHTFEERDGGTRVVDTVQYALRGPGVVGSAINRLLVAPELTRIFSFRHEALQDAFGARGQAQAGPVTINRESGIVNRE